MFREKHFPNDINGLLVNIFLLKPLILNEFKKMWALGVPPLDSTFNHLTVIFQLKKAAKVILAAIL